jgi:Fe-S-cluster containining protein
MPLSRQDIERIVDLGYKFKFFVLKKNRARYLKNSGGKCVFLEDSGCKIYEHRPEGCRLYPLILDVVSGQALIHEFCPHGAEFRVNEEEVQKLNSVLEELTK